MWFTDKFMPNIGEQRPQLLILDGHDSHGHVALLELARKNNIILMELPAHTSNWTQPFDRTVFRPFKAKWFEACDEFVTLTGLDDKKPQFFRLLKKACLAMTPEVLQSGFRACGIVPLNMNAIPEEAHQPGTAYKSPNKGMEVSSAVSATDQSIDEPQPGQSVAVDELQPGQSVAVDELQPDQSVAVDELQHGQSVAVDELQPGQSVAVDELQHGQSVAVDELQHGQSVAVDEPQPDGADLSLDFRLPNSEDLMNISSLMDMIVGDTSTDEAPEVVSLEQMSSKNADSLALHAVESSMKTEQHHQFLAAELSGQTVKNDPLFPAWKKYRTKNAKLEELFPIPTCTISTRKRKAKPGSGYFVLSCDEVYEEKKRTQKEKEMEEAKKQRQQMKLEAKKI